MRIFWSWQSDSPGSIGRFFVRDALRDAIQALKTGEDVLEPHERDAAARLELDSDRQGVPGSPDLAATIFEKIEAADVFVADVTLVGATPDGKKLINSNVAIEYGHAHKALSFQRVLMIQNHHYGDGDDLPFDLRQKSWPLHYSLAPAATKAEVAAERVKFKAKLVEALRSYLSMGSGAVPSHVEIPTTSTKAVFAEPHEIIAQNHAPPPDEIEYRFAGTRALYLRLIPRHARANQIKLTRLYDDVLNRRIDLLLRNLHMGVADRNAHGAIAYCPHGSATEPRAFTQVFPNGEIWAVTTEMFFTHQGSDQIPIANVRNIFGRVLANFLEASQMYGNGWPVVAVMGGVGLRGVRLAIGRHHISGAILVDEREIRCELSDAAQAERERAVETWVEKLLDIAGARDVDQEGSF